MHKRNSLHHRHRRSCRRRKRRSSIHPVPIPCRNRATDRLRPQRQVPFRDMWFRRLWTDAYRGQPLMLTDERPSQKRAQSTTEDATSLLARHRNLTLTMNRLSVMAMAALGGERGTGIGFEPSRVRSFS